MSHVNKRRLDPPRNKMVLEQKRCSIKHVFPNNHVVPRGKRLEKAMGGCIAGGKSNGRGTLLQRGQAIFQRRPVRIALPRVAMPAGKATILGALISGGKVNGRSNIARARLNSMAGMDRSCLNLHGSLGYIKTENQGDLLQGRKGHEELSRRWASLGS